MMANARAAPLDQLSLIASCRKTGQYFGDEFKQRLREWALLDQNHPETIIEGIVNPEGVIDQLDDDIEMGALTNKMSRTFIAAPVDALNDLLEKMGFKN